MSTLVGIVLAAGGGSRMGTAKQLLRVGGVTLVRHAVERTLATRCDDVVVVVGAYDEAVCEALEGLPITVVWNEDWKEGVAGSLCAGLDAVEHQYPRVEAVLITLIDQPRVTAEALDRLIDVYEDKVSGMAACEYASTLGPPAIFHRRHFPELRRLSGDRGAKAILLAHRSELGLLPLPEAAVDVDTPYDFDRLQE